MSSPWLLNSNRILSLAASPPLPQVILVLGAPSNHDLDSLLSSPHLAASLVIIAVHNPPSISPTVVPAVRVLPLSAPLAPEKAGAVTLVSILERAERVARIWRKTRVMAVVELLDGDDGANILPSITIPKRHSHSLPTPDSSEEHINSSNRWAKISTSSRRLSNFLSGGGLPPVDPSQRPFDGLFHFLPTNTPDQILLKQSILVTTIAHPFLCSVSDPEHSHPSTPKPSEAPPSSSKRWAASLFHSWSNHSAPTDSLTQPPSASPDHVVVGRAHLVHLLPYTPQSTYPSSAGRHRLVSSLESFLQSFGYPRHSIGTLPNSRTAAQLSSVRAASYALPAASLPQKVQYGPNSNDFSRPTTASSTDSSPPVTSNGTISPTGVDNAAPVNECTIADLILCGVLDPTPAPSSNSSRLKQKQKSIDSTQPPRVWISGANDLIVLGSNWSSANAASLTKLNLAARPGFGLRSGSVNGGGESRARTRVATGRVPLRPAPGGVSMGMRSASVSNVEQLVKGASEGATTHVGQLPALTRAETDMIVSAFKKEQRHSWGQQSQSTRDISVSMSKLRQVYVPEDSGVGDGAGIVTPPDSETSDDSSNAVTAPTSISNDGIDDNNKNGTHDAEGNSKAVSGTKEVDTHSTSITTPTAMAKASRGSVYGSLKKPIGGQGKWKFWKGADKTVDTPRVAT